MNNNLGNCLCHFYFSVEPIRDRKDLVLETSPRGSLIVQITPGTNRFGYPVRLRVGPSS